MKKLTILALSLIFVSTAGFAETDQLLDQFPTLNNTLSEANNSPSATLPTDQTNDDASLEMKNFAWNNTADGPDAEELEPGDSINANTDNEAFD